MSGFWIGGGVRDGRIGNWSGRRGFFLRRLFCGFGAFPLLVAAIVELLVGGLFLHVLVIVTYPHLLLAFHRIRDISPGKSGRAVSESEGSSASRPPRLIKKW